jgi:hypothetical protein
MDFDATAIASGQAGVPLATRLLAESRPALAGPGFQ